MKHKIFFDLQHISNNLSTKEMNCNTIGGNGNG